MGSAKDPVEDAPKNEKSSQSEKPDEKESEKTITTTTTTATTTGVSKQPPLSAYKRVFTYASRFDRSIQIIAALAALISGAAVSLQALIFGDFITIINDFALGVTSASEFRDKVATFALYFVYIGIGRFALSFAFNYLFTYASHRIVRTIRYEYLRAALRQEIGFYDLGTSGSIATQGSSHGNIIQAGIAEKLGLFLQSSSSFIVAFVIALSRQWKLTLICICIAPATVIVMGVCGSLEAARKGKMTEFLAKAGSFAEEILGSMRTIHAFSIRKRLIQRYDGFLESAEQVGKKLSVLYGILFSSQFTILQLGMGLGFWQGIRMIASGEVTNTGDVFVVLMSVILASTSLTSLAPFVIDFSNAGVSAAELFSLMDRDSLIDPLGVDGSVPESIDGAISLENLSFSYPTRPDVRVLDGFSLNIPAGKTTALVGPSGSGKSTIIGLIERWYNPETGSIKLDGRPIDELNLNWLRKTVRLVQQEPVLFQGSVYDNIKHGLVGTPWENSPKEEQAQKIEDAAKIAFAHDFIAELPEGYDTPVGQRGGLLSGGQKQRIAIARSIVSDPKVLLLDEATSALDPHAEKIVQQALDRAAEGRTTITIAHKLATIRKADNIVVMSQGRLVEQGTHESLIANESTYSHLVQVQNLNASVEQEQAADSESTSSEAQVNAEKTLTKFNSSTIGRAQATQAKYDFSQQKQLGILHVFFRVFKENRNLGRVFVFVLAACLGGAAVFPGQAMLMASMVDVFTETDPSKMTERGDFFASMFIVLAAGCLASYFTLGFTMNIIAQHLAHKYRKQSLNDSLKQDIQFFDREENSAGALSSRLDGYTHSIIELTSFKIGLIMISLISLISCAALGFAYSWKIGVVVVLAGLPPLVIAGLAKIKVEAAQDRKSSDRYSTSASLASESILSLRTVSSLAIEESVLRRYMADLDAAVASTKLPLCWVMASFGFMQAVEFWFLALGFWYGCRLLSLEEVSMYNFMVSFLSVFLSGQSAGIIFQFTTNVTAGVNGANYLFWLHALEPDIQETPDNHDKGPGSDHAITFDHLRFSYPLRPDIPVLRDVNLSIQQGQFVGLVGASGCGKSTIIAMLERFYDPTKGEINIGPSSHTTLNPMLYRRIVALVQQEPTLFKGTIRENVAYGMEEDNGFFDAPTLPSDEAIEQALRAANAWDFTSSLPSGLDTDVGSSGTQLSGGQRQRIAIARALIRDPKILLLDEATSALDTESERVVQDALNRAAKDGQGRITVAIAHRLSTIKHADVICVFYGGSVAEMGTHDELLRRDGLYRKMCEAQALD